MKKFSAIILLVSIFVTLIAVPGSANQTDYLAGDFIDIEDHWAYDQMSQLIAMGILKGYTKTIWDEELRQNIEVQQAKPTQKVTRAEFATLLYQAMNLQPEKQPAPFSDSVPSWSKDAVNTLYKAGIIKGNPDGTFRPNRNISRAEIAAMLVNALNDKAQQTGKYFSDVPTRKSHWAYDAIQKASALSIINGVPGGKFEPNRSAQRAEVMVMLYQFLLNDKTQAPPNQALLDRASEMLQLMEGTINGEGDVDLSVIASYVTGETETLLIDTQNVLNELKQNGKINYRVTYPGSIVKKSDRWAQVVFETLATYQTGGMNLEQRTKEHYYLLKMGDQWYIYSQMDERLL